MITELRRYRIKPDRLESWLAFFLEAARDAVGLVLERPQPDEGVRLPSRAVSA